ncbi:MAG: ABC transporter ATP-binding protein [Candidatus Omnitrophica bacterium]|nr:ABC transporter ATP-binding protein [Candidatus Omnitrophota bacterium]
MAKPYLAVIACAIAFMIISTFTDGASLSMLVPLADKVLTNKPIVLSNQNVPQFINELISKANSMPQMKLLTGLAVVLLVLVCLKGITFYLQAVLMEIAGQRVIRDIRGKIFEKIQYMSMDFFSKSRVGDLISRMTYDVYVIRHVLTEGLAEGIYYSFQLLVFLVVVLVVYFELALIVLVVMPLVGFPLIKVGKRLRKISKQAQDKMGELNVRMQETFTSMNIVKAFSMERDESSRFKILNQDFYKLMLKTMRRTLMINPFSEIIAAFAGVIVLIIGGRDVIAGEMSFGVFMLFLASLAALMKPAKRLIKVYNFNQIALAAGERIFELLDQEPSVQEKPQAAILKEPKESVEYKNIYFSYDGVKDVIKGINLKVNMGEVLCFVGPSGVGKSTLVNLLLRFYDPTSGEILIDGVNIREVKIDSLRQHIGLVTQEPVIFNDTVANNISYGIRGKSLEQIKRAAIAANADEFIQSMPDKYHSIVGERGAKISGGEKQRLAIARAILKNPPILIMDEATAQLDAVSELKVQEAIQRLIEGRTVFLIAHRISTARRADRIIVVDNGVIAEQGKHDELIQKGGLYCKYYKYQYQDA